MKVRRVGGWQDPHDHAERHGRAGPSREHRDRLRQAVGPSASVHGRRGARDRREVRSRVKAELPWVADVLVHVAAAVIR